MGKDWKLINVVLLGLGFMLVFTAFQTTSMVGKYVTNSVKQEKMETPEFNETFVAFKEENYDEYKSNEDEIVQGNFLQLNFRFIDQIRGCGGRRNRSKLLQCHSKGCARH